ncbi:hypothetical protein JCM17960_30500 [Magnetospira thiophila]
MSEMEQALDAVKTLLEAVRREIMDGRRVDLASLEGKIVEACRRLGEGDRDEARALRADVEFIIAELDRLEVLLREQIEGKRNA